MYAGNDWKKASEKRPQADGNSLSSKAQFSRPHKLQKESLVMKKYICRKKVLYISWSQWNRMGCRKFLFISEKIWWDRLKS